MNVFSRTGPGFSSLSLIFGCGVITTNVLLEDNADTSRRKVGDEGFAAEGDARLDRMGAGGGRGSEGGVLTVG
jgi:hypothetical protein